MTHEIVSRLRDMDYQPDDVVGRLHYSSFPILSELDTAKGGQELAVAANAVGADLIILDTVCRFVRGEENSNDTWQDLYHHSLRQLKRQGRTVLRLDHTGHDIAKGSRGATAKRDDADVIWAMKVGSQNSEGACAVTLTPIKQRQRHYPSTVQLVRYGSPLQHLPVEGSLAEPELDKTAECMRALDSLNVPLTAGRDKAAAALRSKGHAFGNGTISAAIKARKQAVLE
jgi:hypothetical protein